MFIHNIKYRIFKFIRSYILRFIPEVNLLSKENGNEYVFKSTISNSEISSKSKLYPIYHIYNSSIGDYTYIARNSFVSKSTIGKFCSIGPNFLCGWGIHPTNGLSTSPMFYSTRKQNGVSLSTNDKIEERKEIKIGNDVFIGANVTILDGVTIGDGAVIGAGAVVSKDIPPYAVCAGCPIKILRFRFENDAINKLLSIKWWDWEESKLSILETYFFDVDSFIKEFDKS